MRKQYKNDLILDNRVFLDGIHRLTKFLGGNSLAFGTEVLLSSNFFRPPDN